jgi:hypothetical protein
MLWGKKDEELPEALRGKTPEQVAAALAKISELEATVNNISTERDNFKTQLTTQQTEFEQVKTKMAELEANQKPPEKPTDEGPASIWTNPDEYIKGKTKDIENAALLSGTMTAKLYAKQGLSARDQKIWTKYEKEIDQVMNGFQPQQRILPQSWLMALTLTKGNHEAEISAAERSGTDFFAEGGGGGKPNDPPPEDKLTPEEEETCRVFKWDPKRYLAQKKKMSVAVGEKGGYAHFGV